MAWKGFFGWQIAQQPGSAHENATAQVQLLTEPKELLRTHRRRLNALRLESGFPAESFERLIGTALYQVAEYVHLLPATRAEHHTEPGGLFRLAVESACLAFRCADGKFLGTATSTPMQDRERDRVRRYAAFLSALLLPLGRCATYARVLVHGRKELWNPYQEPLWIWARRVDADKLQIQWSRTEAKSMQASAIWIAARIVPSAALTYLQSAEESLTEKLLQVLSGEPDTGRLNEIVQKAYAAAIDQDLARSGGMGEEAVNGSMHIEPRLLEAMRLLVREKWTLNTPGGRLWLTHQGVFIAWKAAVNDMIVSLRANGMNGAPRDPDTIAQLLMAHGVLAANPHAVNGHKHYYKIVPQLRGTPKQSIDAVKLADVELLGLRTEGVDAIEVQIEEATPSIHVHPQETVPPPQPSPEPPVPVTVVSRSENNSSAEDLKALNRFGEVGQILKALVQRLLAEPGFAQVIAVEEGVAIAYPQAIAPFCRHPQQFLLACEAQGLLVADTAAGRRTLRTRAPGQSNLPEHYVILSTRVAKYLPLSASVAT